MVIPLHPGPTPRHLSELLGIPRATTTVLRDEKGRLLPGQRLNPGGNNSTLPAIMKRIVASNGGLEQATQVLCDIAWGRLASGARLADRMRAIEILFDRIHGKAHQTVDLGSPGKSAALAGRSLPELLGIREKLRALRGGDHGQVQADDTNSEI